MSYTGEQISSDSGLLLLREVENQIGLIDGLSPCISDARDQRYIGHTIKELVARRVFRIAAGYEDCNGLRGDMVFKACACLTQAGTMIIVRGDSHFASRDFMKWCPEQPLTGYITGLPGNKKLHRMASLTIESAERESKQYGKSVKRCHSFMYQAGSWGHPKKQR